MSATMTTTLATSHLRGSSRQTRTNPTRTSKIAGTLLRQNSLLSNPPLPQANPIEPHGFYPAIQHFTDAITALPRDYRRHTSLLKEVDAKAWAPEENLQALLTQCLAETTRPVAEESGNPREGVNNIPAAAQLISVTSSAVGVPPDNASQSSTQSADPATLPRRQLFASLRQNLIQMMVTMDEKNHVINNASEELSRHLRRLDNVYPHITEEVSEEARLGSMKHWAYIDVNKTHKAQSSRKEAANSLQIMHDTEIAQRSESRREAMLAKKRLNQVDSDFDETRATSKKGNMNGKSRRIGEITAESAGLGISGISTGKRKKPEKAAAGGVGMERSLSSALGGRAMSREPSQQDGSKKRKAPSSGTTVARKRLNANPQDSPKLVSSPLAAVFSKDAHKRSPIPSAARPVASRARQNSNNTTDGGRVRPPSSASFKNGNGAAASTSEPNNVLASSGKITLEVRSAVREPTNNKGDHLTEDGDTTASGVNGEASSRGGARLERSSSRSGALKREANASEENLASRGSPRIPPPLLTSELRGERNNRGRGSKTSTPVIGSFAESETPDPVSAKGNGNGKENLKRPARPRMKDHGLHDSLSPKALPPKRSHKKGAGLLAMQQQQHAQRHAGDVAPGNSVADGVEGEEEDGELDGDDEEERYCYCNGVSYGEMVACDNKSCLREWFHLECAGLKTAPAGKAKWYCQDCKEILAKKGKLGSVSSGSGGVANGR